MKINYKNILFGLISALVLFTTYSLAEEDVVDRRLAYEKEHRDNPFLIKPYKPTYVLPFYYNAKVLDNERWPAEQSLQPIEFKFQLSFKVPLFTLWNGQFYAAYTQQSYWQAYNTSPFFRESNYEPEILWRFTMDRQAIGNWKLKYLTLGANHQSNGRGGERERSWNRLYVDSVFANGNWMFGFNPWYIVDDSSVRKYNPDIHRYLGYSRTKLAYNYKDIVFTVEGQNMVESAFKRGGLQASISFPITKVLKLYMQGYSGYGQNLIEYDHYNNSVGIGIALNDWI